MSSIDWKSVWEQAIKSPKIFPTKIIKDNTVAISCPTRFSNTGAFSIDVMPSFNDENALNLQLLIFNDNIIIDDISKITDRTANHTFNALSAQLVKYELSNRILDRFEIKSDGFKDEKSAINTLIDYLNNKATESGHMFDDKLDELNDKIAVPTKSEKYTAALKTIKENRKFIFNKVACILKNNYNWRPAKNESFDDSATSFFDTAGNLAAVVTLIDNYIIVDVAKNITAKINVIQSDEDIENELTSDINNAQMVLADDAVTPEESTQVNDEIEALKDAIDVTSEHNESYLNRLERKITKLENFYINYKLKKLHQY